MGFGHRVYKTVDPRAAILKEMLDALSRERGERKWYEMSVEIMDLMASEKGLYLPPVCRSLVARIKSVL